MAKLEKQKLNNTSYFAILGVVTVIVIVATFLFAKNLYTTLTYNQKVLGKKSAAVSILDKNVDTAKKLVDGYVSLQPKQTLINDSLPSDQDIPGLGNLLLTLSKASSASFTGVGGSAATASASTAAPIPVSISFNETVSYSSLPYILSAIESSARPIIINSLSISGTNQALLLGISATTYYMAPSKFTVPMENLN
jgi:hypothetical protein